MNLSRPRHDKTPLQKKILYKVNEKMGLDPKSLRVSTSYPRQDPKVKIVSFKYLRQDPKVLSQDLVSFSLQ